MKRETIPWGDKVITVEGSRVVGLVTNEGEVDVAENLFLVEEDGGWVSLYGVYNGVRIPIGYGADITVPHIVLNFVGIELTTALSSVSFALASIKLLSTDFKVDFEECIASVNFNGTPLKSYFERSVNFRRNKYGNEVNDHAFTDRKGAGE